MMQEPMIQLDSDFEPFASCKGCRSLLCEVIRTALRDCLNIPAHCGDTPKDLVKRRAYNWIFNPSHAPRSFNWFCVLVDVDPDCVREILNKPNSKAYKRLLDNLRATQGVYAREPRIKDAA